MKVRKFVILKKEYDKFMPVVELLGYKSQKCEEKNDSYRLTLARDNDNNEKINFLENKYIPKIIPFWLIIIPIAIIFALMTTYLIVEFAHLWEVDKIIKFLVFFIPSSLLLAVVVLIYFLRSNQINKIASNQRILYNLISEELQKDN